MKMGAQNWFKKKLDAIKDEFDFRLESLILDITEKISIKMKQKGMNRVKLAQSLNVSPPAVTKILNGTSNFTLRTLLSLADALDFNLKIDFEDKTVSASKYISKGKVFIQLASGGEEIEIRSNISPTKAHSSAFSGDYDIAA